MTLATTGLLTLAIDTQRPSAGNTGRARAVGRLPQMRRPIEFDFPENFPERLARFKEASGLTWRSLAVSLASAPTGCGSGGSRAWPPAPPISSSC